MYAIGSAVELALQHRLPRALIVSDSLSVLEALKRGKFNSGTDPITLRTCQLFHEATTVGTVIKCLWIPSHSYIHGNDIADILANEGRYSGDPPNIPAGPQELWPRFGKELKHSWTAEFFDICAHKAHVYATFYDGSALSNTSWFNKVDRPRRFISTILRLRSGHCLTPHYLHRMGLRDSDSCDCGVTGDIVHVFFGCSENFSASAELYAALSSHRFPLPINIYEAIFSDRLDVLDLLIEFLVKCRIAL
ncbi:uncharacterized protein LOC123685812 [Harmonia axyridis]|uniref:uncharacterized protein LOC123685812 n=1 Tax=Harmonia axyridis TaxID=115357 RepID=UPI001E276ED0|nr:uncharacterized protein LOC123685812 [Harmonia axyridis]